MNKIRKYDLEIVVFVCGAAVMIFELIGSRIIAPYVGTSTYVWASIIGVVLGSLSAGYYYGGRLADARPNIKPLAIIICLSAIAIIISTIFKDLVSAFVTLITFAFSIEIKSLLISLILFGPASFFLGMVSPYAMRLKVKDVERVGGTSGNLYAISTLGSIVGTFLAGFYLIPYFSSFFSLISLSIILILIAFFLLGKKIWDFFSKFSSYLTLLLILVVAFPVASAIFKSSNFVADIDTKYNRVLITKEIDYKTKRPIMAIAFDPLTTQSAIFIDNPDELVFEYTKFFKMAEIIKPDAKNALLIGGSVYTYPRDFLKNFPKATMDVVEIDPSMTEIAKQYFGLKDDIRMNIIHEDGRIFLNDNKKKYDIIFNDVFNSFSIPFHLTTLEAIKKNFKALEDDGVVFVNIISALEGEKGKFFRAEYSTFKKVFPNVYVFVLDNSLSSDTVQNLILLASKEKIPIDFFSINANPLLSKYSEKLWTHQIDNDVPILTDDFAPVEFYKRLSI